MDWVIIEKPSDACKALLNAKTLGQGVTFSSDDLGVLVKLSQDWKSLNPNDADFSRLCGKASKALDSKINFPLTAGEVTTWVKFFEGVQTTRIAALKVWVHNEGTPPVIKLFEKMEKVYPRYRQDTFVLLAMQLSAKTLMGEGSMLKAPESQYLRDFCHWHEKRGSITPAKQVGDPLHPRVTAMEKLCGKVKRPPSSLAPVIFLDSEETSSMHRIMQQLNGYAKPDTEENQTSASKNQEANTPGSPSSTSKENDQAKEVPPTPLAPKNVNQGAKTISIPAGKEAQNTQPKSAESKNMVIDNRMQNLVTKFLPDVVPGVLNSKQPIIIRWVKPMEDVLHHLESKHDKVDDQLEELRSVMTEDENEYEQQIAAAEKECAELHAASQGKIEQLETELQAATDLLSKQTATIEKKHEEELQIERDMYAKLKKDGDEKFAKVESEVQAANSKNEKAKTAFTKQQAQFNLKLQSSKNETKAWEDKYNEEVAKSNVLRLDYDATLQEIGELKAEHTKILEREARCVALESEVAVLRSSRTNPQVEKDNIAKAVRDAIAEKQVEVDKFRAELGKLAVELQEVYAQLTEQSQLTTQREAVAKEKEKTIVFLNSKLLDAEELLNQTNNMLSKANEELEALRQSTPDAKLLRNLEEERMESQHFRDRMESIAALLQDLTLQLVV